MLVATHSKTMASLWDAIFFINACACALQDHLALTWN